MSMSSGGGDLMSILDVTGSGMAAQAGAMNVYAHNMALAQTSTPDHQAYGFEPMFATGTGDELGGDPADAFASLVSGKSDDAEDGDDGDSSGAGSIMGMLPGIPAGQVAMTGVRKTATPVDTITQMVNMMNAQRVYESQSSLFDESKSIAQKTIQMGQS